jgi:hypothetical protein
MDLAGIVSQIQSSGALGSAAQDAGVHPDNASGILRGLLEHAQEGGAAEGMIETVAAKAGVSPQQVEAFLPQIMPLIQGHAQNAPQTQSGLGGLMGSLGGLLR